MNLASVVRPKLAVASLSREMASIRTGWPPKYALLPTPRPKKLAIGTIRKQFCEEVPAGVGSATSRRAVLEEALLAGLVATHRGQMRLAGSTQASQGGPRSIYRKRRQNAARMGRCELFLGAEGVSPGIGLGRRSWDWAVVGGSWSSEGSGRVAGIGLGDGERAGAGGRGGARGSSGEGVSRHAS